MVPLIYYLYLSGYFSTLYMTDYTGWSFFIKQLKGKMQSYQKKSHVP